MPQQVFNIYLAIGNKSICVCLNFPQEYLTDAVTIPGETIPMSVAVGDRVLMPEWGSNKLEMEGEEFHVIRETDIVAKLAD